MVSFRHPDAIGIAQRTKLFTLAESLGGVESLIEVPQAMTHQSVEGSAAAVPADLVRLSCGVEAPEDLVDDLASRHRRRAPEAGRSSGQRLRRMPRRIDLGRAVLFAGSALLLISLFTRLVRAGRSRFTGWQVFETLDLVLAALAVAGMVAAVRPDIAPPWAAVVVPGVAVFIVFVQLIDNPPAAGDANPAAGAWIALAGAFLMAAGAALSLAAISVTVQVRERDVRRRVAAVDRRGDRDREDDEAADLDADADGADAEPKAPPSLFARAPAPATPGPPTTWSGPSRCRACPTTMRRARSGRDARRAASARRSSCWRSRRRRSPAG